MTPMPVNPKVVVLVEDNNKVAVMATNVTADTEVVVTRDLAQFNEAAKGMPFQVIGNTPVVG